MKKATAALLGILLLAGCSDGGGGIFSGWGASCEMTHFQPVENTGQRYDTMVTVSVCLSFTTAAINDSTSAAKTPSIL